jgi:energy-coupling factor transport system substrate-specific component
MGFGVGFCVHKKWLKKGWQVPVVGVTFGVIAAVMSSVIITLVSGGVAGTGLDALTGFFSALGAQLWISTALARIISEPIDKTLAIFITWVSVKNLPEKYARLFKYASKIR